MICNCVYIYASIVRDIRSRLSVARFSVRFYLHGTPRSQRTQASLLIDDDGGFWYLALVLIFTYRYIDDDDVLIHDY